MNKLKMIVLNEKNEKVNEFEDQKDITTKLLSLLWSKYILKSKSITRVHFNYNYSDIQKITFYFDTKYKYEFSGIPTSWGSIKENEIYQLLSKEN